MTASGLAVPYRVPSLHPLPGWAGGPPLARWVVAPGAFAASLAGRPAVPVLVRHDWGRTLPASAAAGTLALRDRADGLHAEISCPATLAAARALPALSLGWTATEWRPLGDGTLLAVVGEITEVSLVGCPGFPGTELHFADA